MATNSPINVGKIFKTISNPSFYPLLSNLINNFVTKIPITAATIVAIQTGKIIFVGLFEPNEFLIAITVVGIICKDAVFITINITIEFVNLSLCLLFYCIDCIAFIPNGVAAFPNPNIFAIIFIEICF